MDAASDSSRIDASFDRAMMRRAISLARKGQGHVSPNPMVGAVLVRDGRVIATGYHHKHGAAHAEVDALSRIGFQAAGCTLYVTLEPCCHQGMTPPCTSSVISSGVRRVVVGMVDPNPVVSGRGIARLQGAGIQVTVGVLGDECLELNRGFARWIVSGRPWVTLKMAVTLDGRSSGTKGPSGRITGEAARRDVLRLRAASDCVMVGANTALSDDPLLLADRRANVGNPIRAVVSTGGNLPSESRLIDSTSNGRVILLAGPDLPPSRLEELSRSSVEVVQLPIVDGVVDIDAAIAALGAMRVTSVLVEGGHHLAASLLKASLVDRLVIYYAPLLLGDNGAPGICADLGIDLPADSMRFRTISLRRVGEDVRMDLEPLR